MTTRTELVHTSHTDHPTAYDPVPARRDLAITRATPLRAGSPNRLSERTLGHARISECEYYRREFSHERAILAEFPKVPTFSSISKPGKPAFSRAISLVVPFCRAAAAVRQQIPESKSQRRPVGRVAPTCLRPHGISHCRSDGGSLGICRSLSDSVCRPHLRVGMEHPDRLVGVTFGRNVPIAWPNRVVADGHSRAANITAHATAIHTHGAGSQEWFSCRRLLHGEQTGVTVTSRFTASRL